MLPVAHGPLAHSVLRVSCGASGKWAQCGRERKRWRARYPGPTRRSSQLCGASSR